MTKNSESDKSSLHLVIFLVVGQFHLARFLSGPALFLKGKGLLTEIWDISAVFGRPTSNQSTYSSETRSRVWVVGDLDSMLARIREQSSGTLFIHSLSTNWHLFRARRLFQTIRKEKIRTAIIQDETVPEDFLAQEESKSVLQKLKDLPQLQNLGKLLLNSISARVFGDFFGRRALPPEVIWYGASLQAVSTHFITPQTELVQLHEREFDQFLELRQRRICPNPNLVFVDGLGPLHPDFDKRWSTLKMNLSVGDYANLIEKHLNCLHQVSGLNVTVALHPSCTAGQERVLYPNLEVVKNKTAEAIASSQLVVQQSGSRAVYLAVLLRKPILTLTAESSPPNMKRWNEFMMRELGQAIAPFETYECGQINFDIDENRYQIFQDKYIAPPNSPQLLFWESVYRRIKSV